MGERVFVTGATGFIGANLVRLLLEKDYKVRVLVRENSNLDPLQGLDLEMLVGDLNDEDLSEKMQGCDYLFHVAAVYSFWQRDKELLYKTNVLGTRNVFNCARKAGIKRIVYTSSVAAIGVREDGILADEDYQDTVEKLIGNYKKSKYYAEQEAYKAVKLGQDIVIVNPTTPIGAYDSKPTPTGEIILRFLRGKMPAFVDTGLNFVHVKDVAIGHILALEKGKKGRRYILGNQNLTLAEFLEKVAEVAGKPTPKIKLPHWLPLTFAIVDEYLLTKLGKPPSLAIEAVKMSSQYMYYNPSRAIRELGLPQTDVTLAIQDAVAWFREYFKIPT